MTRARRNAASKSDAENVLSSVPIKNAANAIRQSRRKPAKLKENKENLTKTSTRHKTGRMEHVQPFQEKNEKLIEKSAQTEETEKNKVEVNFDKKKLSKVTDKVKETKENMVPAQEVNNDRPLPKPVTRLTEQTMKTRRKMQSKNSLNEEDKSEAASIAEVLDIAKDSAAPSKGRKVQQKESTVKRPAVVSPVKTRSHTKRSKFSADTAHRKTGRHPKVSPIKEQSSKAVSTLESENTQMESSNNVNENQKDNEVPNPKEKLGSTVSNAKEKFVTARIPTRKFVSKTVNEDKPQITEPVSRNVTTRRFTRNVVSSDQPNEVKAAPQTVVTANTNVVTRRRVIKETTSSDKSNEVKAVPQTLVNANTNVATRRRVIEATASSDKPNEVKALPQTLVIANKNVATRRRVIKETASANKSNEVGAVPQTLVTANTNVATRRRVIKETASANKSNEVEAVSVDVRAKRSQSQPSAMERKFIETNSKEEYVKATATPSGKRKVNESAEQVNNNELTKLPTLSANQSSSSNQSNKSNVSALPIYKRECMSNNVVDSVFDFESNSQENTLQDDEREVVAKLVRDNKAVIVKRRRKPMNGATKAKAARSKKIEKIRTDLMELKKLELIKCKISKTTPKVTVKTPTRSTVKASLTVNPKEAQGSSKDEGESERLRDDEDLSLMSQMIKDMKHNNRRPSLVNQEPIDLDADDSVDHTSEIDFDIFSNEIEGNCNIPKAINKNLLSTEVKQTPPQKIMKSYAGPMKTNTFHQSTPVRIVPSGFSSPWRIDGADPVKHTNNVFSRYSALEKSPIKFSDTSKTVSKPASPTKKIVAQRVANEVPQKKEPKTLKKDIENYFGFVEDDDIPASRPSLPPINGSFVDCFGVAQDKNSDSGLPPVAGPSKPKVGIQTRAKISTPIRRFMELPKAINNIKETIKAMSQATSSTALPYEVKVKTQSKITSHFGDQQYTSQPSSSKESKIEEARKLGKATTSKPVDDTETFNLFDTNWPEREDKPRRSYTRVPKRNRPFPVEYRSILTDDESEFGDTIERKRTKRSKKKDVKYEEELKKFENETNSHFNEIEQFEVIVEKSTFSNA